MDAANFARTIWTGLGGAGSEMLGAMARKSIDGFVLSPPAGNQAEADGTGVILGRCFGTMRGVLSMRSTDLYGNPDFGDASLAAYASELDHHVNQRMRIGNGLAAGKR